MTRRDARARRPLALFGVLLVACLLIGQVSFASADDSDTTEQTSDDPTPEPTIDPPPTDPPPTDPPPTEPPPTDPPPTDPPPVDPPPTQPPPDDPDPDGGSNDNGSNGPNVPTPEPQPAPPPDPSALTELHTEEAVSLSNHTRELLLAAAPANPKEECGQSNDAQNWEKFQINSDGTIATGDYESAPSGTNRVTLTVVDAANRIYAYVNTQTGTWTIYRIVLKHGQSANDQEINNPPQSGTVDGASSLSHITFCLQAAEVSTTGKLEVIKDHIADGTQADDKFNLRIDGATAGTGTNVGDGGTTGEQTVTVGSHTVGESEGTGSTNFGDYDVDITCRAGNGQGAVILNQTFNPNNTTTTITSNNITVGAGDDIVCVITNTDESVDTGTLEVVKNLSPQNDLGKFDLFIDPNGGGADIDNTNESAHNGTTGENILPVGTYEVGETADDETSLSDYTSSITCVNQQNNQTVVPATTTTGPLDVAVGNNQDILCTITNTRKTGELEVVKNLVSGSGLFDLFIDPDGGGPDIDTANEAGHNGTTGPNTLATGTYEVGETADGETSLSNYSSSISCVNQANNNSPVASGSGAGPLDVTVGHNQDVLCTVTNTERTGQLEVRKDVVPDDALGSFNLFIKSADGTTTHASETNAGDGGTTDPTTLPLGVYQVSETAGTVPPTNLNDFTSSIICLANDGTGPQVAQTSGVGPLNVTVTDGSDIVCTITNASNAAPTGQLEVVKELSPSDDPGKFTLLIEDQGGGDQAVAEDVGDGGTTGPTTLESGDYDVLEVAGDGTNLSDYDSSIDCKADDGQGSTVASGTGAGPVTVAVGENDDILCTITNTRKTAAGPATTPQEEVAGETVKNEPPHCNRQTRAPGRQDCPDPAEPAEAVEAESGTLAFTGLNLLRLVVLVMILLTLGGLALDWSNRRRATGE